MPRDAARSIPRPKVQFRNSACDPVPSRYETPANKMTALTVASKISDDGAVEGRSWTRGHKSAPRIFVTIHVACDDERRKRIGARGEEQGRTRLCMCKARNRRGSR